MLDGCLLQVGWLYLLRICNLSLFTCLEFVTWVMHAPKRYRWLAMAVNSVDAVRAVISWRHLVGKACNGLTLTRLSSQAICKDWFQQQIV